MSRKEVGGLAITSQKENKILGMLERSFCKYSCGFSYYWLWNDSETGERFG